MIDDEPGIRRLVSRTLSSAGFQVDCAEDGPRVWSWRARDVTSWCCWT
jgi:DNA-binding response OmpR family regulator